MKPCVLIVSPKASLRGAIARVLQPAGYTVELAADERRSRDLVAGGTTAAAIVAPGSHDGPGLLLARELCDALGCVVLIAEHSQAAKALAGAVPLASAVLAMASIEAELADLLASVLAAPCPSAKPETGLLRFAGHTLDVDGRCLLDPDGSEVPLTRSEFTLLAAFARHAGRVLSRDRLRNAVGGRNRDAYDRSIDMLVARLRRKIETNPKAPRFIITVPGEGYKFAARPHAIGPATTPSRIRAQVGADVRQAPRLERRHLSVLAGRFVGVAALSARLDAEDLHATLAALASACADAIRRFGGLLVSLPGDRLVACFGHPEAREDDAWRAVKAAVELTRLVQELDNAAHVKIRLQAGIASGVMVVGDPAQPLHAGGPGFAGEPLDLAQRLTAAAMPGDVIVDAATRMLLGSFFEFQELAPIVIEENLEPAAAWRITAEGALAGRFDALRRSGMQQLVGRDEQMDLLLRRWRTAQSGSGGVVVLSGEPGIGKSRLAAEFEGRIDIEPRACLHFFGLPHHSDASFFAITGELARTAGFAHGDAPSQRLGKLDRLLDACRLPADESRKLIAGLLSLPVSTPATLAQLTPRKRKEKTFAALLARMTAVAARHPVLVVVEDAQWIDPTSLEFLSLLVERAPQLPLLMVMTARPEFVSPWPGHPHVTVLSLPRLAPAHARHLVESVAGRTLPRELASRILAPTEGVPLFIEEVAKSVLELGILPHDRELLDPDDVVVAIPGTLQASLMARLDRLGPGREIAQIGAVIGREFSYELLQLVAAMPEPALHAALERVTASELTYCRGSPPLATYVFKHVLVRDAAYGSLVRSHRQELHAAVARGIEAAFPEVVESEPELLAHHHREAGQTGKAVGYLLIAAERALSRSATTEALALLGNGLAMLGSLPEGRETLQQALALQIALGRALIAARGYSAPETREAYQRARMLCEATRNEMLLPTVILAEWVAAWTSADHTRALERAQQLRRWAERDGGEPAEAAFGHLGGGMTLTLLGRFTEARFHLESALAIGCFTPPGRSPFLASDADGRISALTYLHDCLMLLGWLDEAEATRNKAIAERPTQLYSLAMGHAHLARMHVLRRDIEGVAAAASAAQRTSEQQGYPFLAATGMVYAGWALAQRGSAADGITVCCEGIGRLQALGAICWFPRYYAHLAECYDKADDPEGGLRAIADGLQTMRTTGEHAWEAELHRLKARFLIRTGELEEAEQCLAQALTVARGQQARLLELRAATSLARLLAQTNDHARARAVLGDACAWFKQGAISADVVEAKAAISAVS